MLPRSKTIPQNPIDTFRDILTDLLHSDWTCRYDTNPINIPFNPQPFVFFLTTHANPTLAQSLAPLQLHLPP